MDHKSSQPADIPGSGREVDGTATQHDGTSHLAVNDTFLWRTFTLLALKTTSLLGLGRGLGRCTPISKRMIIKTGKLVHLTEAATMKFVAETTSIPVPRVYCAFVHKNQAYILMERIEGNNAAYLHSLPEESRAKALEQLRQMLLELRALKPPPGTGIESCIGGSLHDCRIGRSSPRFGPFETVRDFHSWLRNGVEMGQDETASINDMIERQDKDDWPPTVFTHGDLNPGSILVRGDKIVGIIDWEFAGWYPHYWEYTSAWLGNFIRPTWRECIPMFLDEFPEELEMEKTRSKWWDPVW